MAELPRQFEPNRDADHHPQAGLLGKQGTYCPETLLGIFPARCLSNRLLVRLVEPAALSQGLGEHALQRRSRLSDDLLGLPQPIGIGDRCDCGIEVGVGEGAVRH